MHTSLELWLGYGHSLYWLCSVWTFLIEELTNEIKALEDVLREKEGKKIFFLSVFEMIVRVCVCVCAQYCGYLSVYMPSVLVF